MSLSTKPVTKYAFKVNEPDKGDKRPKLTAVAVPPSTKPSEAARTPVSGWVLELWLQDVTAQPIVLQIAEDTILGRETNNNVPDVDLAPLGAWVAGVSRNHLLLRPTSQSLYVIDLKSSRGTYHNGIRLSSSEASKLSNNDTLALGELAFRVKLWRIETTH